MLGVQGLELNTEEIEILQHPRVGGVILFAHNYRTPAQVAALVASIHRLRQPRLLVAVDQEGGRVQRFRDGFTRLPPVRRLGEIYDTSRTRARELARITGWLMAIELRAVDVDFSFAPVLDLDRGVSTVIGDRAFHRDPHPVTELGHAYMSGMQEAGMEAVAKHFPGHGSVAADSHRELPVDDRGFEDISVADLQPFANIIHAGVAGIMPAHVVYSQMDDKPAGFSPIWLRDVLRQRLGFTGAVFSDDLDMAGAGVAGTPPQRARAALAAGCDMVLACQDRQAALAILDDLGDTEDPVAHLRLARLHGQGHYDFEHLRRSDDWHRAVQQVRDYDAFPLLDMDI